jgi:hypothetical protein
MWAVTSGRNQVRETGGMGSELKRPRDDAGTWAVAALRIVEIATESWRKLAMISILLLVLAIVGVAWGWLPHVW